MKNNIYKSIAKVILLSLVMVFVPWSSLTAQPTASKQWKMINEGDFETTYGYQVGEYVVKTDVLDAGKNPAIINGKQAVSPINIWSLKDSSYVEMTSNWSGDPMNPMQVFKTDDTTLFITDHKKIYRADINFRNKVITYEKVFEGTGGNYYLEAFSKSNNNIYYGIFYYNDTISKNLLYICNKVGQVQKILEIKLRSMYKNLGIVEWKDTIYVGYSFVGGIPDGSGLARIDTNTGVATRITGWDWDSNLDGCTPKLVNGHFYLNAAPGTYKFRGSLFEYKDGIWKTLIIGAGLPEEKNGKLGILVTGKDLAIGHGHYPNGDTINSTNGTLFYEFFVETGKVGNTLEYFDKRLDLGFGEQFSGEFYSRHGYTPAIDFIYEYNGRVFGFGPSIVAELVDKLTGINDIRKTQLNVYPNPTTNVIHVSGLEKETDYMVIDMAGKVIIYGTTMEVVDLSSLQPGMYMIKTESGFARILKQ